jgi:hypothetical protein
VVPEAIVLGGNGQLSAARSGDPDGVLPTADDGFFQGYFDYAREDAWLSGAATRSESS